MLPGKHGFEREPEHSTFMLRSSPERSFGKSLVPNRFQLSGGTAPDSRSVTCDSSSQRVRETGTGLGAGCRLSERVLAACSSWALSSMPRLWPWSEGRHWIQTPPLPTAPARRTTADHSCHRCRMLDAKPNSPRATNSESRWRRTPSGSTSRVSEPSRKLCRKLLSGQAPVSANAGGQWRST